MELMIETSVNDELRFFESENYFSQRTFFENGVVDYGNRSICFDFSQCKFNSNACDDELDIVSELNDEDIVSELSDEETELELIEW